MTDSTVIPLRPEWAKSNAGTTRMRPNNPNRKPPELPREPSIQPREPMIDAGSAMDIADTAVNAGRAPLKVMPLDEHSAVLHDPAEPARQFRALAPKRIRTEEESSHELPRPAEGALRDDPAPQSMAMLLGGIFIGAGLAISGCVIALLISG